MRQNKSFMVMGLVLVAALSFAIMPSTANAYEDIANAKIVKIGTILSGGLTKIVVTVQDEGTTPKFTGSRQYFLWWYVPVASDISYGSNSILNKHNLFFGIFIHQRGQFVRPLGDYQSFGLFDFNQPF